MPNTAPRIAFAGSPAFACPSLNALVDAGHPPVLVLTQPDRPAGRGRKLTPCPVKTLATELGLNLLQPESLKTDAIKQTLHELNLDVLIVVAYGQILDQTVLDTPRLGCINVHASILPRWRGAAPIQASLIAGDKNTGVTLMQMDRGLDTGNMLAISTTPISETDTGATLAKRLADIGANLLTEQLPNILSGNLTPIPQSTADATHAGKIKKSDAQIDWTQSADQIARNIRAYTPWPVAYTLKGDTRLRIWRAEVINLNTDHPPGTIISANGTNGLVIQTGKGQLRALEIQLPGKTISSGDLILSSSSGWLNVDNFLE